MLKNLIIRNYALIEHLDLEFGPGLTIITGETGAGKSIMLGALSLVMGGRADTKVISDGGSKSVVEVLFTDVDEELIPFFEEKGIDWVTGADGVSEMTIRREAHGFGPLQGVCQRYFGHAPDSCRDCAPSDRHPLPARQR